MKAFLERTFGLSIVMGILCVIATVLSTSKFLFLIIALGMGFLGFIMCCMHIVFTQKYKLKQPPAAMLLISLFLNSVPLIYIIVMVMNARGK